MNEKNTTSLTYKDAGVDIDAGNALVEKIKHVSKATHRPGVLGGLGGFGAMFELPDGYKEPVLVSGTDGVGTKLRLAMDLGIHDSIGIDLVAMCVNDLIVAGAEPLFFLDYYATGKLSVDIATSVIEGIGEGCKQAGCALVGGETAEMPGMYEGEDYDLAGFCVGVVEKSKVIDGSSIEVGDNLIALASTGPHSNGYSLIRKILEVDKSDLGQTIGNTTLDKALLSPTKIYVKSLLGLMQNININAMAHITGGGLLENIPRVLPEATLRAEIDCSRWQLPSVFAWLQQKGNIVESEMYRTFNCGIGMVVCISAEDTDAALKYLNDAGETAFVIGEITACEDGEEQVLLKNIR